MYVPTLLPNPMGFIYTRVIGLNDHGEVLIDAVADAVPVVQQCSNPEASACFGALWSEKAGYQPILTMDQTYLARYVLNERGEVAGRRYDQPTGNGMVFIWSARDGLRDIAPVQYNPPYPQVVALNNRGEIAGTDVLLPETSAKAFFASEKEGIRHLDANGSLAAAMNDSGEMVGERVVTQFQAFYWTAKDGIIDLWLSLGAIASRAIDINKHGLVLGEFEDAGGARHFFLWEEKRGVVRKVPLPSSCRVVSLNSFGQVIGNCSSGVARAWVWTAAAGTTDVGTLGYDAVAFGQNDRGEVVGRSRATSGSPYHAFVWSASAGMVDLDPDSPLRESIARFINKHGVIAGEINHQAAIWRLAK